MNVIKIIKKKTLKGGAAGNMPILILLGIVSIIAVKCLMEHSKNENKLVDRIHYG